MNVLKIVDGIKAAIVQHMKFGIIMESLKFIHQKMLQKNVNENASKIENSLK